MLELVPGFDQPVILPPGGDILLKAAADVSAHFKNSYYKKLFMHRRRILCPS
jgi:hypothetical protein